MSGYSLKRYHQLYDLLCDLFKEQPPTGFKSYFDIDWSLLGNTNLLMKMNDAAASLSNEEYGHIIDGTTTVIPKDRLKELMPLFYFLAKIQSDADLLEEIKTKQQTET